jgi:hypothetical protein
MNARAQSRQPVGVPAGGQFTTQGRNESGTTLGAPVKHLVGFAGVAELDTQFNEDLPRWPENLPEPSDISYSWGEDDHLEVTVVFGDDTLTMWGPSGDQTDSFTELEGEYEHISRADQAAASEYALVLHEHLSFLVDSFNYAAHTPKAREQLLSLAMTGKPLVPVDDPDDPAWCPPAVRASTRAETNLKAWFGTTEVDEPTIQDVLTDLMHYADANGADFDELLDQARFMRRSELDDPES